MIFGNIDGIKKTYLDELERLYKVKVLKDEACSVEIIEVISRLTSILDREISVAVDRRGKVVSVAIGDSTSVEVSMIDIREKDCQVLELYIHILMAFLIYLLLIYQHY